jgi:mannose-6-phosphate isomerase-like protein (cupin superfamily)
MATVKRWDPERGPLQLSTLRAALQQEGLATAWWSEVPGTHVPQHEHPFPEARWVLSGFLRVFIGDEIVELGPGDRLDLPSGTTHGFEVMGLAPAVYVTGSAAPTLKSATPDR